jgi:hypothetical protein
MSMREVLRLQDWPALLPLDCLDHERTAGDLVPERELAPMLLFSKVSNKELSMVSATKMEARYPCSQFFHWSGGD